MKKDVYLISEIDGNGLLPEQKKRRGGSCIGRNQEKEVNMERSSKRGNIDRI